MSPGENPISAGHIEPMRLYQPHEAAELLGLTETELVAWGRQAGIREIAVAGQRRYWGCDLLRSLGALPLPDELMEIKPMRLYRPHEAAKLLGLTETELLTWGKETDIEKILVANSRRYWGYDLLQALGALPLPNDVQIMPNRGYTAQQAARLLGAVDVQTFRRWSIGKVPIVTLGDQVIYMGYDLISALKGNQPPLDRIEPNAIYNREQAMQAMQMGKDSLTQLINEGYLVPILVGTRRQLFRGRDLLDALLRLKEEGWQDV